MPRVLAAWLFTAFGMWAQVCDPAKLAGPYGFQLSGATDISGAKQPATSFGRVVFDGHGNVTGVSSAMFNGYFLGNPVTGTYEARTDCTLTWQMQSDSGAFQHFAAKLSPDLASGEFRQTDPGGAQHGVLIQSSGKCTPEDLRGRYGYSVTGSSTPMQESGDARTINAQGTVDVARNGTFVVDADCMVQFDLVLLGPSERLMSLRMRGVLVDGGSEILAIETDAGAAVSGHLREPK